MLQITKNNIFFHEEFFFMFFFFKISNISLKNIAYYCYLFFIFRNKKYLSLKKPSVGFWRFNKFKLQRINKKLKISAALPFLKMGVSLFRRKVFRRRKKKLAFFRTFFKKSNKHYTARRINFLRYTNLRNNIFQKHKLTFSLTQRVFLSSKNIMKCAWQMLYTIPKNFFFKKKKKLDFTPSKKKKLFMNVYRPILKKLRKARFAHWELRTLGKLNEYRYNKLLGKELKYISKIPVHYLLSLILLSSLYCSISWRQMFYLVSYSIIVYNGSYCMVPKNINLGDIIELPFGGGIKKIRRLLKKHYKSIIGRAKKLSYRRFISFKYRLRCMRRYKQVPKIIKSLPIAKKFLGKTIAYDSSLNIVSVIVPINPLSHSIDTQLTKSSVLSLQNWRYRFD